MTNQPQIDLDEIEARLPSERWTIWDGWGPDFNGLYHAVRVGPPRDGGIWGSGDIIGSVDDLERVVSAVNALPALVERVRSQQAEIERLTARIDSLMEEM